MKGALYTIFTLLLMNFYLWINSANAAGWHYYDPDCPISLNDKSIKFVAMQPKKILTASATLFLMLVQQ